MTPPTPADAEAVRALLGREPDGDFEIVVRDAEGEPLVIRNAPLLHDGRPMPTRFWLVGRRAVQAVSRLEAAGGVRRAEAEVPADLIADAHRRYATERDDALPADHRGPRPSGGVAGTREGVKCLHAHYAWHLAGGDDPVGRWVAEQLRGRVRITVGPAACTVEVAGDTFGLPVGPASLTAAELHADPPLPAELTNAIGAVTDHLDDLLRDAPGIVGAAIALRGAEMSAIAAVEAGRTIDWAVDRAFVLDRAAAEDVFRTLATEAARDRALNPGLPADQVGTVVGATCLLVAVMRRLRLDAVQIDAEAG